MQSSSPFAETHAATQETGLSSSKDPAARQFLTRLVLAFLNLYALGVLVFVALRLLEVRVWWMDFLNSFALWVFVLLPFTLLMALVLRAWRSTLLHFALLMVPVVWIGLPALARAPQPVEGDGLTLITYNLWVDNEDACGDAAWLAGQDVDVIILQEPREIDNFPCFETLLDAFPHHRYLEQRILLLSYLPIVSAEPITLVDMNPPRVAMRAVLRYEDQPIVVYGVHLRIPRGTDWHLPVPIQRPPFSMVFTYDESIRNMEIERLLEFVQQETLPVIVAGDFNTSAWSLSYDQINAVLNDSYAEAGTGLGLSWLTDTNPSRLMRLIPPLVRIDYVWHNDAWSAREAMLLPAQGSDHFPLRAELVLKGN